MRLAAALALALLVPVAAAAQQAYVPIEQRLSAAQLREVGLSPPQLETLNRMLREAPVQGAAASPAPAAAVAPRAAQEEAAAQHEASELGGQPIRSRLKGSVASWEPGTVFELENGQQWKVLKGSGKLRTPLDAPEIVVVPGIAGRWFLQVDEDLPKARVYRID
ncbi:hypothetical protein AB4Y64_15795 [Lysobacter sp. TAF61]|uniref:hypothetical protein n=1 Tax=Lysobacter sp. TAF61 TaxID=3233072 RepID=UPI003F9B4F03